MKNDENYNRLVASLHDSQNMKSLPLWVRQEMLRASAAIDELRGQVLNETMNGVMTNLEHIAAGRDTVTGDPLSIDDCKRLAMDTLKAIDELYK